MISIQERTKLARERDNTRKRERYRRIKREGGERYAAILERERLRQYDLVPPEERARREELRVWRKHIRRLRAERKALRTIARLGAR